MEGTWPALVAAATSRARSAGFGLSCEPAVGRLLAVLAAHLPAGARVLELGTGAGVGTAWITWGLLPRTDVTVKRTRTPRPWPPRAPGRSLWTCERATHLTRFARPGPSI